MSRIGKKPVTLPAKVTVTINGHEIVAKGPKGQLAMVLHPDMKISQDGGTLHVERPTDEPRHRALHGLSRALLNNLVNGVATGFRKTLLIEGTGYRAEMKGTGLEMYLGYSHPIQVPAPAGITFTAEERGTVVHIDGVDRQLVGQIAANLRGLRPPEPYHGKGVRYKDEVIRRKAGKAGKAK